MNGPADATALASGLHADPAVRVAKLGYVGFRTADVARLLHYYTTVLDFELVEESPTQAFLTTGFDHHCVVVDRSETPTARTFVGYEVHGTLDDAEKRLRERGYTGERRTDIGPGTPDVLVIAEPGSGTPLHLYETQVESGVATSGGVRPSKLGHVAAYTPGLPALQSFYQELLGFRWSDTIADFFVFLRCNTDHHAANFMASTKFEGLHHVAYEARDLNHLQMLLDRLAAHDHRLHWGPGRHGPGHNIFTYHNDPDGNQVELFTQLDVLYDESRGYFEPRPWHESFPQYPKTWEIDLAVANKWGPVHMPALDH
jgi:catechol 2,3-dioxygenase-like lactoylglutathione lyase family enzyme